MGDEKTKTNRILDSIKNHKWISFIIVACVIVIGVSTFLVSTMQIFESTEKIVSSFSESSADILVRYDNYERTATIVNTEVSYECRQGEFLMGCIGWIEKENGTWEKFNVEPDFYTKSNRKCSTSASPGNRVHLDLYCARADTADLIDAFHQPWRIAN